MPANTWLPSLGVVRDLLLRSILIGFGNCLSTNRTGPSQTSGMSRNELTDGFAERQRNAKRTATVSTGRCLSVADFAYARASSKIVRTEAFSTESILRLSSKEMTCCSSTASWERR